VREETSNEYQGPWPTLSVWHGDIDLIANHVNAGEVIKQWTNLHATDSEPDGQDEVEGYPRYLYQDPAGRVVVEFYDLIDAGHSTPVDPQRGCGDDRHGFGDFIYDYGICSSFYIARFWGLTGEDTSWPPPGFVVPAAVDESEAVPQGEEEAAPAEEEAAPEVVPEEEQETTPAEEEAAPEAMPEESVETMPADEEAPPAADTPVSEIEQKEETLPSAAETASDLEKMPLWVIKGQDEAADEESGGISGGGAPLDLTQ
jgi:hypothetical protein